MHQLIVISFGLVGFLLIVPELAGGKIANTWGKTIADTIVGMKNRAKLPIKWSDFFEHLYEETFSVIRSALWICVPIGVGFLVQGDWKMALVLILGPWLPVLTINLTDFLLELIWFVLKSLFKYRIIIVLLQTLNKLFQQLKIIPPRRKHVLMIIGIVFILIGIGIQISVMS